MDAAESRFFEICLGGLHPHNAKYVTTQREPKENSQLTLISLAAYWIAFGPHGPRAQAPADEGRKVALYVAIGVGVSLAVFSTMRMFAKPPPPTMTKEYQEASNEFVKVRSSRKTTRVPRLWPVFSNTLSRLNAQNPLPVSPRPATRARVWSSRRPSTKPASAAVLLHRRLLTLLMMTRRSTR